MGLTGTAAADDIPSQPIGGDADPRSVSLVSRLRAQWAMLRRGATARQRMEWLRGSEAAVAFTSADLGRMIWKEIKGRPPAERERFLKSPEAIAGLGARQCRAMIKGIESRKHRLELLAGAAAWVDAYEHEGIVPAGMTFGKKDALVPMRGPQGKGRADGRRYAARLVLSRAEVRWGMEHPPGTPADTPPTAGPPSRRWMPPQAVDLEDLIDLQSPLEAIFYPHPASPSAAVIRRIGEMKAKEQ